MGTSPGDESLIGSHRLFHEREREGQIAETCEVDSDPIGRGASGSHPFVEGTYRHPLADELARQTNVQTYLPVKVSDLSARREVGESMAPPSRRASDYTRDLGKPSVELVAHRHYARHPTTGFGH